MTPTEKITIGVITESKNREMYLNIFKVLLDKQIVKVKDNRDQPRIETDTAIIQFVPKLESSRGFKFDHVFNLTQDEEFHKKIAKFMVKSNISFKFK